MSEWIHVKHGRYTRIYPHCTAEVTLDRKKMRWNYEVHVIGIGCGGHLMNHRKVQHRANQRNAMMAADIMAQEYEARCEAQHTHYLDSDGNPHQGRPDFEGMK